MFVGGGVVDGGLAGLDAVGLGVFDLLPLQLVVVTQFWPKLAAPSESSTMIFWTPGRPWS